MYRSISRQITRLLLTFHLALLTLVGALHAPANAQGARVDRLVVVESGFYTARNLGKPTAAPGTVTGRVNTIEDIHFLDRPPEITAKVGTSFGIQFRSVGARKNAKAQLRSVWLIPEPGITNPRTKNTYRQSIAEFTTAIGTTHTRGYTFDDDWEVVRGTWTLQIWQGDRKLAERSFDIK